MKTVIVDTNVFLRFLLDDIPKQKNSFERVLLQAKKQEIILSVPQIVIFEVQFILEKYYQIEKEVIIDHLRKLVSIDYLDIQSRTIFLLALRIYSKQTISFPDCFLVAQAKIEKAELFTFDKKLQKLV